MATVPTSGPADHQIREQQHDVSHGEHPPAPPSVGQPADRHGQRQIGDVGADVQQREPGGSEVTAVGQRQVQEPVTDGEQPQHAGRQTEPAQPIGTATAATRAGLPGRPANEVRRRVVADPERAAPARRGRAAPPRPRRRTPPGSRAAATTAARTRAADRLRRRRCPAPGGHRRSVRAWPGSLAAVINASRGAVRKPLPSRSTVSTEVSAARLVAGMRKRRATAEAPYPTTATRLGRSLRSASQPPRNRTTAVAPWYRPSRNPKARGVRPSTVVR